MPDEAAESRPGSSLLEAAPRPPSSRETSSHSPPPPHGQHAAGAGFTDAPSATLPPTPTLTPATTTRQSVPLGVLSTLWGGTGTPTILPPEPSIPAIVTHAPSPDTQELPSDLTASAGSVPSTTTTLTNTLPPTQSAAIRALNAPAFQSHASSHTQTKAAKSTSSRTSLSSQPVVVRTYSGSRNSSRQPSGLTSPRYPNMNGHASQNPSALSAGLAGRSEKLPSLDDFSFSAILRAVDPEIRDAIDAIAEICAKSKMSLADEYDAHLPPQGEITSSGPGWAAGMGTLVGRGRMPRNGQIWTGAAENALTAVPEASSSTERLAGESKGSPSGGSRKRGRSAYGSLKSVISGGSGKQRAADVFDSGAARPTTQRQETKPHAPAWAVNASSPTHPAITIVTSPQASKQLSLDTSSTITDIPESEQQSARRPQTALPKQEASHRRNTSLTSLPALRSHSGPLASLASWLPWPRPSPLSPLDASSQQELTKAETRLREMLVLAQDASPDKGNGHFAVA